MSSSFSPIIGKGKTGHNCQFYTLKTNACSERKIEWNKLIWNNSLYKNVERLAQPDIKHTCFNRWYSIITYNRT